jgi:hypothetical protein
MQIKNKPRQKAAAPSGLPVCLTSMKAFPIHQNLSTSFVNLSALVCHLRDLQFTGSVRVELSSYEAEIIFTSRNRMQAREYDRLAGRISQGEHAFKRILVRAREPFGRIHVLRSDPRESAAYLKKAFVDERIISDARQTVFGRGDKPVNGKIIGLKKMPVKTNDNLTAILLATELLLTVSDAFEKVNLNFDGAFQNACAFVGEKYAFLDPNNGLFVFENDEIRSSERLEAEELFEGIVAALGHIFDRLRQDSRFGKLLLFARHRIQTHRLSRRDEYEKFSLNEHINALIA